MNWTPMKIAKSGHKKVRLLNEKIIKEKLMKKAYNYMVWLKKEQKNLRIKLETLKNYIECEKLLNINK